MSIFALCKKLSVLHTARDLEGFDLIIFENLDKSLESQYSKIKYTYASLNKKEPTPETYFGHFSLQLKCAYCLSIFLTG